MRTKQAYPRLLPWHDSCLSLCQVGGFPCFRPPSAVNPVDSSIIRRSLTDLARLDTPRYAPQSLFNEMLTLGIPPEQRAYAMLLSAYGNAKQQQDASQLFLKMPRRYQEDGLVREAIWRCFGKDAVQVFREAEASRPGAARPGKASKANR
ncbi:unnamed protein product [Durusdinium trenchii]|uniref:Uncharacterized protein n=1 Tax=Durusdinium trenchii TaxID=1381693 RepID=A0ABP0PMP9_9DINO